MGSSDDNDCCMYCDTGNMFLLYSSVLSKATWQRWEEGYERRRSEVSATTWVSV